MIWLLLWSTLGMAFSSEPPRDCQTSADCVLVRETWCNYIRAIRLGHDKEWAEWEAKDRQRAEREKQTCKAVEQSDVRRMEAVCVDGLCDARMKPPVPVSNLPPLPPKAGKKK